MIKKIPKSWWIFTLVLCIGFYQYQLNDMKEQKNELRELYQTKNETGFLALMSEGHSFIPFAESLEKLSKVSDGEDPAKVQKVIELAKTQSIEAFDYIFALIEFSDDYMVSPDPQYMVNQTVMTSREQEDTFFLAFSARPYHVVYETSSRYWKDRPKIIPQETKDTLASVAKEMRALDSILISFKEEAKHIRDWGFSKESWGLKSRFLAKIKPHLRKMEQIRIDFMG